MQVPLLRSLLVPKTKRSGTFLSVMVPMLFAGMMTLLGMTLALGLSLLVP